jgi:hypothetical protein
VTELSGFPLVPFIMVTTYVTSFQACVAVAIVPSHMPRYLLAKANDPLAKARCKAWSLAKTELRADEGKCSVCGGLMDAWEQANRRFACPRCKMSLHFHCSEVCTLCHEDFCPTPPAGKHDCPAAAAAGCQPLLAATVMQTEMTATFAATGCSADRQATTTR